MKYYKTNTCTTNRLIYLNISLSSRR